MAPHGGMLAGAGGPHSIAALGNEADALHFIYEAYNHCKTIPATGEGCELVAASLGNADIMDGGKPAAEILLGRDAAIDAVAADFIAAIAQHRHWSREMKAQAPA
ncbi:MAG: hypothetical protein WAW42_19325 [Candidatus Competibacteraceae bacterium]